MTKEAIIRGMVAWAEDAVLPQLTPTGALSVGMKTAFALVKSNPAMAEKLLNKISPAVGNAFSMAGAFAGDDKAFDSSIKALKEAIESEPQKVLRWQFCEIGLFNNTPHSMMLNSEGVDEIVDKIREEAAKEKVGVS